MRLVEADTPSLRYEIVTSGIDGTLIWPFRLRCIPYTNNKSISHTADISIAGLKACFSWIYLINGVSMLLLVETWSDCQHK